MSQHGLNGLKPLSSMTAPVPCQSVERGRHRGILKRRTPRSPPSGLHRSLSVQFSGVSHSPYALSAENLTRYSSSFTAFSKTP